MEGDGAAVGQRADISCMRRHDGVACLASGLAQGGALDTAACARSTQAGSRGRRPAAAAGRPLHCGPEASHSDRSGRGD